MNINIWNPAACGCKNTKYFAGIIDDSVIMRDEVIDVEETKIVTTNFNEKNAICKRKNFCILLAYLYYYGIIDSF